MAGKQHRRNFPAGEIQKWRPTSRAQPSPSILSLDTKFYGDFHEKVVSSPF